MSDIIIRMADVTAAGHCARGARRWFETHGLDYADFLKNGITRSKFMQFGDALAEIIVERTVARRGDQ